jgi:hypothetical protein
VTGLLGLFTAGILAVINDWIGTRAGIDETLRAQRLAVYPKLWKDTKAVSRWPRSHVTRGSLQEVHRDFRSWYYSEGGLFMSESARERYGDVQELIGALLQHEGDPAEELTQDRYTDLMNTTSALRTALTEDLNTRRRPSLWDRRRQTRWNEVAARSAKARLAKVGNPASVFAPAPRQ